MLVILVMIIVTVIVLFCVFEMLKAKNTDAVEVLLSKSWYNLFLSYEEQEKKKKLVYEYEQFGRLSEKKLAKKVKEYDKQIEKYQEKSEKYKSGKKVSGTGLIPLIGYQLMKDLRLDAKNDLFRKFATDCEHTGYVELERDQTTGRTANSYIYAKFIIAGMISFSVLGIILAGLMLAVGLVLKMEAVRILIISVVPLGLMFIIGYLPYDNITGRAAKRRKAIEVEFGSVISKLALLVTSGMSITKAIAQTAESNNGVLYDELSLVIDDINTAYSLNASLMRIQRRCDNRYLDKLVSIVGKSYVSGNANLAEDLRIINRDCWLEKKHNARRMGEAASNRLFIPTIMMFIGLLIVIMVPALSGFSF